MIPIKSKSGSEASGTIPPGYDPVAAVRIFERACSAVASAWTNGV